MRLRATPAARAARLITLALALAPAAANAQNSNAPTPPPASAPAPASKVALVIEGGFEFGGDEIIEILFTNGDTQKLTAGQGGTIAIGGQFQPASIPRLSLAATVGYKFVTNASENASIGITRIPLELIGRWKLDGDWSLGAGVVRHASVNVKGDGFVPDVSMDASTGATLELGWRWAALTWTTIEYTDPIGGVYDAGSVGVSFRWVRKAK
jgi:hypothetical protein